MKLHCYVIAFAALINTTVAGCAHSSGADEPTTTQKKVTFTAIISADGKKRQVKDSNGSTLTQLADGFSTPAVLVLQSGQKVLIPRIPDQDVVGKSTHENTKFLKYCTGETDEAAVAAVVLPLIIKPLIKLLFGLADKKLEKELKAYNKEYEHSAALAFLRVQGSQSSRPVVLGSNVRCFRFVRGWYYKPNQNNEEPVDAQIDFDFVAQIKLVGGRKLQPNVDAFTDFQAMQIVPYRTMTNQPSVKKADKVSYALSAKVQGINFSDGAYKFVEQFDRVITKGSFKPGNGDKDHEFVQNTTHYPHWDPDKHTAISSELPLLPLPGNISESGSESGLANFQIKVAEAGTGRRKARLDAWRKFLGEAKDDVSDTLASAVGELVKEEEAEEDSDSSASDS